MQIELNKQRATSDFDGKYPNMIGFVMGPGTQVVVNDIVKAANKLLMKPSSMEFDPVSARLKVLADIRQKVNPNFEPHNILVSAELPSGSCEIICPQCQEPKKLAPLSNTWPTQFNIYNFERHFVLKHSNRVSNPNDELIKLKIQLKDIGARYESECLNTKKLKRALMDLKRLNETSAVKKMKFDSCDKENNPMMIPPNTSKKRLDELTRNYENIENEKRQLNEECLQRIDKMKLEMRALNDSLEAKSAQLVKIQNECVCLKANASERDDSTRASLIEKLLKENSELKLSLEARVLALNTTKAELQNSYNVRKRLLNSVMDLRGNYRVFVRVRPKRPTESSLPTYDWSCTNEGVMRIGNGEINQEFQFDNVFGPKCEQSEIFDAVSPLIQSAIDGYNVCILAYGPSGSGKTFTIGGILPDTAKHLFESFATRKHCGYEYTLEASFLQIYNERLSDLLHPECNEKLEIRTDGSDSDKWFSNWGSRADIDNQFDVFVTNLSKVEVKSSEEFLVLVQKAMRNRKTKSTNLNTESSRSHFISQLWLKGNSAEKNERVKAVINIVDLAGMESVNDTGNKLETGCINKSLSELNNVINALKNEGKAISYRNSKLTHLLKPSLSGNSKTLMFVNVSPLRDHFNNSKKSLMFGASAMATKLPKAKANKI